jgi:hypothetical protein
MGKSKKRTLFTASQRHSWDVQSVGLFDDPSKALPSKFQDEDLSRWQSFLDERYEGGEGLVSDPQGHGEEMPVFQAIQTPWLATRLYNEFKDWDSTPAEEPEDLAEEPEDAGVLAEEEPSTSSEPTSSFNKLSVGDTVRSFEDLAPGTFFSNAQFSDAVGKVVRCSPQDHKAVVVSEWNDVTSNFDPPYLVRGSVLQPLFDKEYLRVVEDPAIEGLSLLEQLATRESQAKPRFPNLAGKPVRDLVKLKPNDAVRFCCVSVSDGKPQTGKVVTVGKDAICILFGNPSKPKTFLAHPSDLEKGDLKMSRLPLSKVPRRWKSVDGEAHSDPLKKRMLQQIRKKVQELSAQGSKA